MDALGCLVVVVVVIVSVRFHLGAGSLLVEASAFSVNVTFQVGLLTWLPPTLCAGTAPELSRAFPKSAC